MEQPGLDPRITWAIGYMHDHLGDAFSIRELAERVNLSPSRFRALFTTQIGLAPAVYLQRLRLRRARLLVERTFLSIKEVMALVGYNDPSHFSRDFKQFHNVLPSAVAGRTVTPALAKSPRHRRFRQSRNRDPGARCA